MLDSTRGLQRVRWWWRGVLLGSVLWLTTFAEGCPSMCVCKWKGGKEWVECAKRGLIGLPQGAGEGTQVLDLADNHLVSLPPQCFQALGLTNLQRLYLSRSKISHLAETAFMGLTGLVELDLSGNQIGQVPSETFPSYAGLMRLILNGNPIREVRRKAFHPLVHLTVLEMSECRLEAVEQNAFFGLGALEWLRLDGNRLTHVPEMTLPLGGSLRGLTLHNNPWMCDCKLRPMQAWLQQSAPAAPQEAEPTCEAPTRLHGKQIKTVKVNDLACLPKVNVKEQVEVYEGANLTLRCDVHAVPSAKVTWWFNGVPYEPQNENDTYAASAPALTRYYYRERGHTNKSNTLHLQGVEQSDEGTFTCVAENSAGSAEANLSLRVLMRERGTIEPPFDQPSTGYVAAVAAGALIGTLFALGCVIGSVLFCTKRRQDRKRSAKSLVTQGGKGITPVVKESATLPRKELSFERQQQVLYGERELSGRSGTLERREPVEGAYRSPAAKYLTEPDLINEVPEATEGYGIYQQQRSERQMLEYDPRYCLQPELPQIGYLGTDGYPVDFGLPKISFASTLPRRLHPPQGTAAAPQARYSREAEFLARSTPYDAVIPRSDARYTAEGYPYPPHPPLKQLQIPASPTTPAVLPDVPFIPSPPAAYRGEPTPMSPRSLLGKTAREAAAAVAARAEGAHRAPEHSESPDEGYVGETVDV
ncbi:leucine-rich repeat-containing protein 24-like [Neodiprion virginianus]|uniref:leucine-rich repeat-containing protein 24-like n=1 Tax=Neodiprion virginianus TaxID=2961670 RepID=UPI001EE733B3|nr:leucine-rich repeat-containing protein 24-like [Neodiprion virginianus]XP_046627880.1 leucine-rich repeat-containing protein 24-like [Neodiprion virginianus]XP_046627881.1 leucine-rich repeat-containing protein 24-like [Neodiprion virginianus]XP_046627882.1 leucine-rich repeat-containing protein 24-like [Neodiprion virginianus]XP_046627883.1 leucine-rich repeat-containing protein 24-like [Neodiprion virginianus]XP_046627884.1 leucine-rich repeat-containing protein 24-like [Neodiprion virgin